MRICGYIDGYHKINDTKYIPNIFIVNLYFVNAYCGFLFSKDNHKTVKGVRQYL